MRVCKIEVPPTFSTSLGEGIKLAQPSCILNIDNVDYCSVQILTLLFGHASMANIALKRWTANTIFSFFLVMLGSCILIMVRLRVRLCSAAVAAPD